MKLNSEQKKKLYEVLEKDESAKELIEPLKADLVTAGQVESELNKAKSELEQFAELDIAGLKAAAEFVDTNGGTNALLDLKAKAEGYEQDMARRDAEKKQVDLDLEKYKAESEEWAKKAARTDLVNKSMVAFSDHFNTSSLILNNAIDSGYVYAGENGDPMVKVGDVSKPLTEGIDMLKEVPEYKTGVKAPTGTGQPLGGVPNPTPNTEQNMTLGQRLDAAMNNN